MMNSNEEFDYEKYEEDFKELDKKEYIFVAKQLSLYREAMQDERFERDEAMQLVYAYAKFIYDMGIEEFIRLREERWAEQYSGALEEEDEEDSEEDEEE